MESVKKCLSTLRASVISFVVIHKVNLSIQQGTFPWDMKRARVIPLFLRKTVDQMVEIRGLYQF